MVNGVVIGILDMKYQKQARSPLPPPPQSSILMEHRGINWSSL